MSSNNDVQALKSGIWYTAANFLVKSMGFITTPIFSRLLSHSDYGLYSNYSSWLSIITVFLTLNLSSSFFIARYDFEDDFDGYISSSLVFSSIVVAVWASIVFLFPDFFVSLTGIEIHYLYAMMFYLLFYSAIEMFQTRERYFFKYTVSVALSLLLAISSTVLSVLLVTNMQNKLSGRIIGGVVPTVLVGIILYNIIMIRGRKVNVAYWKYALPICLPYIPHLLSLSILNSMDKTMITRICGPEDSALYSVAYSCGAVITVLITSLNTAFSPWLGEKLHSESYGEINRVSKYYMLLFVFAACGIMLVSPEVLLVMGGRSYSGALYVMPPVAFGCVCQFLYTMHVNIEQYQKRTVGMAIASIVAALSNYVLNSIFIPRYGFIAAAYTTLVSYSILLFIHMMLVRRMRMHIIYPTKTIIGIFLFMCLFTILVYILYQNSVVRYGIFAAYVVASGWIVFTRRDALQILLRKKQ